MILAHIRQSGALRRGCFTAQQGEWLDLLMVITILRNHVMRRFSSFLVYLTLALWLPATQHCALEAAGLVSVTCNDCSSADHCGGKDGCSTVESGGYKPAVDALKALAPDLIICASYFCSQLVLFQAERALATLPRKTADRPRDWVPTWNFVRRAAPSPRAPSLSLA